MLDVALAIVVQPQLRAARLVIGPCREADRLALPVQLLCEPPVEGQRRDDVAGRADREDDGEVDVIVSYDGLQNADGPRWGGPSAGLQQGCRCEGAGAIRPPGPGASFSADTRPT